MKRGHKKVKSFLVENNIKQKEVAEVLGMSVPTFNKKLNGSMGADFHIGEARVMCLKYGIKPELFFDN